VCLPTGLHPVTGLPIGVQLVGRPGSERLLLGVAAELERLLLGVAAELERLRPWPRVVPR
jgi:amidase